jgi:hypothetical protein
MLLSTGMAKKISSNLLKTSSTEVEPHSLTPSPTHMPNQPKDLHSEQAPFTFGKPGPFQIIECETLDLPSDAPKRRYSCTHYETCLNMAAALNWDNFTCRGCNGEVNSSLLWRAQAESKKDSVVQEICPDFSAKCRKESPLERSSQPEVATPYQMLRAAGKR